MPRYPGVLWLSGPPDQKHAGAIDLENDRLRVYVGDQLVADWSANEVQIADLVSHFEISAQRETLFFTAEVPESFRAATGGGLAARFAKATSAPQVQSAPPPVRVLPQLATPKEKRRPPAKTPWYKRPVWVLGLTVAAVGILAAAFGRDLAGGQPSAETARGFDNINDLRDAVEEAGITCTGFSLRESSEFATSSADCTEVIVLAIHESEGDARAQHELRATIMGAFGDESTHTLLGQNWSINCPEDQCETLQTALGGEILFSEAGGGTPEETSNAPAANDVSTADFNVQIVVLEEQCFDSAGSLITAEPELFTDVEDSGVFTITFQVAVEGGIDTYSIEYDSDTGQYSYDPMTLSTATCNPDLTATVTRVTGG